MWPTLNRPLTLCAAQSALNSPRPSKLPSRGSAPQPSRLALPGVLRIGVHPCRPNRNRAFLPTRREHRGGSRPGGASRDSSSPFHLADTRALPIRPRAATARRTKNSTHPNPPAPFGQVHRALAFRPARRGSLPCWNRGRKSCWWDQHEIRRQLRYD
jgi:hypothetical protein